MSSKTRLRWTTMEPLTKHNGSGVRRCMFGRIKPCLIAALLILTYTQVGYTQQILDTEPPAMTLRTPESIIASFVRAESRVREALNQHTFKREVVLQTIGPTGEVTGQYIRHSQFLLDDKGNRIERVTYRPPSTIRELRITKEDIQDLAGAQLLGFDVSQSAKYRLTYAGQEMLSGKPLHRLMVEPIVRPNPHRMSERFFCGLVWVDAVTSQVVKVKGKAEPEGKQRFPTFETWREPVTSSLSFATRTEADDVLHFPKRDVKFRMRVKYYDYKLFASKLDVKEIDAPAETKACVTNHNAPPMSAYYWPPDTEVKVYLKRGLFTAKERDALIAAMKIWSESTVHTDTGVTFSYAGESDDLLTCKGCLNVTRRDVYRSDQKHYAWFNPLEVDSEFLLLSASIHLDFATTAPQALQAFMLHELGHGMGLRDCQSCKKKKTIMSSFPGINKDNGLVAPSTCDLEVVRQLYQRRRRVPRAGSTERNP